jgi:uncharacterized protein (TIGR03435 family)
MGNSQISGGLGWLDTDVFSIRAKAAGPADPAQLREMLQTLLAERFQLKIRREMKEVPAMALVVAKKPKEGSLTPADGTDCKPLGAPNNPCGQLSASTARIVGRKVTIAQIAQMLTALAQRRVIDQTGLKGVYDIKIELAADPSAAGSQTEMMEQGLANIISGLESQLGFKTETIKWQDPVIVVERAEKPAEN